MPRKSSRTQIAYERLRADLLACRLKPGEPLRLAELCTRLSVSLGAVREALSRLTSEGLVSSEPQHGFRAAAISAVDLKDLTGVRTEIEGSCLRRAIAVGDVAWEGRIVSAFHQLSRTPVQAVDDAERLSDEFAAAHARFHEELVSACDSPWLLRLRAMLFAQSERYRRLTLPLERHDRDRNREHRQLMEAVLAKDAERAATLMKAHVEKTTHILLAGLASLEKKGDRKRLSAARGRQASPVRRGRAVSADRA